ncbi:MAG TPA: hypothetical protein V6D14_00050 [Coleofasciculaceae cyanobacterium]
MADEPSRQTATEAIEERPTNRAHATAIEMMNLHESSVTCLLRTVLNVWDWRRRDDRPLVCDHCVLLKKSIN